jgi:hypothetical protein
MNPTKKKVAAKKKVSKKKEGKKILIHLEATLIGGEKVSNGNFRIEGSPLNLAALLATAMDTSLHFKKVVALALSAIKMDLKTAKSSSIEEFLEGIIDDVTDPINHAGHGCDFDPEKKSPKKKATKKSK